MLKAARDQGVEVLFDALVSTKPILDDHSARLECQINGDDRRLDCKYLVVADGSRSPISQLLGIRRIPCKMRSYQYTCSVFDSARRDVLLYWVPHHPSGITEMTGLGSGSQYTLVSRLPTEFSEFSADDLRQSRLPKMINQAAASIGIDGKLTEGPMPFSTDMDRLEEVAMHPRVLCVGDAARKGDPGFGGNMNEAVRDGRRFGAYLKVARQNPRNSENALKHFRKEMQGATSALQTGGALTNNMRAFFSIGDSAQALLPEPIRSLLHFDVSILMKATGTMVGFLNSSSRSTQQKR
jgi:2-polyprenyl-6-methoxyphenol hydroxylase-like FAD-dependent oxidoreductase